MYFFLILCNSSFSTLPKASWWFIFGLSFWISAANSLKWIRRKIAKNSLKCTCREESLWLISLILVSWFLLCKISKQWVTYCKNNNNNSGIHRLRPVPKQFLPAHDKKNAERQIEHLETFIAIWHYHEVLLHNFIFYKNIKCTLNFLVHPFIRDNLGSTSLDYFRAFHIFWRQNSQYLTHIIRWYNFMLLRITINTKELNISYVSECELGLPWHDINFLKNTWIVLCIK